MLLHVRGDGPESMPSRRTQRCLPVPSITQQFTGWRVRSRGSRGIVLISFGKSWRMSESLLFSLQALPGEVSTRQDRQLSQAELWAGPGYRSDTIFDLAAMQPYNLRDIYESFRGLTGEIALYLPRSSDLRQLAKLDTKKVTAIHYCMEGASKVGRFAPLRSRAARVLNSQ